MQVRPNPNLVYLRTAVPHQRVTLLQGSTRSGKTHSIADYFIEQCLKYSGVEYTIFRETLKACKSTVWSDFEKILKKYGIYREKDHHMTDHIYRLNGNTITYMGGDDDSRVHGYSGDVLWINEAQFQDKDTIDQLMVRTRHRVICDYNPRLGQEHWLDRYIDEYPPLITTYKDNPHLTKFQIDDIESKKGNSYWWAIYGEGLRAALEGAVFPDWEVGEFDNSLPYLYGQDVGFHPDPQTLVKVAVDNRKKIIYADEKLYNNNRLGTDGIITIVKDSIDRPNDLVVSDIDNRLIADMKSKGLNVVGAKKPNVADNLRAMVGYKIIVTKESFNLKKELSNYIYNDKRSGIPIDKWNHLIDPIRYAFNRLAAVPQSTPTPGYNLI